MNASSNGYTVEIEITTAGGSTETHEVKKQNYTVRTGNAGK
jgi:hypothetical protein